MILHTVTFTLKHSTGSEQESDFLKTAMALADLPMVRNFKCLRQIGEMSKFSFGLSMEFDSEDAYQTYNNHPLHKDFVAGRWVPEVSEFLELDYTEEGIPH